MSAKPAVAVVEDSRYRDHRPAEGHPEHPDRLLAVGRAVEERAAALVRRPPREASDEEILRVHGRAHVDTIQEACARAPLRLDPDTYVSRESAAVARLAAGGAVDVSRAVARGELRAALAAVRPPGHHAESDRAMGFCLFNNVAIVARALQRDEGLERVLILDWDVHHGNGTQHSFESDPGVVYVSTHQFPFYPGTGAARETGVGRGSGATVNVPLPPGSGDPVYTGALRRVLVPVARQLRPEILLVSCGFDAHRDDPLASMEVSGEGYREMARIVRALADDVCGGRLVFLLEGGYSATGLYEGTSAVLDVLLEPETPRLGPAPELAPGDPLGPVVDEVAAIHGSTYPGIGRA